MLTRAVHQWLRSWWSQCLLRRAPQNDALSYTAMQLALILYLLVDIAQARASAAWPQALAMSAVDTAMLVAVCGAVLGSARRSVRFTQTLTALAGTGALIGAIGVPLIWQVEFIDQTDPPPLLVLAWLLLLVWSIAVQAHIYRHALSSRFATGVLVAGLHIVAAIIALNFFTRGEPG